MQACPEQSQRGAAPESSVLQIDGVSHAVRFAGFDVPLQVAGLSL